MADLDAASLKAWRKRCGMGRADAAQLLGLETRTLIEFEAGGDPGSLAWGPMARLVEFFGGNESRGRVRPPG